MTPQIQSWLKKVKYKYIHNPKKVLEIGSRDCSSNIRLQLNETIKKFSGLDTSNTVKKYFSDADEYIGIDLEKGKNVDLILNAHDLSKKFKPNSFDAILCLEVLEHDPKPWITIKNVHRTLKPDGFLAVSTPTFGFPLHRYPKDYYRFGIDAYKEVFFKNMQILDITKVRDFLGHPGICGLAKK